MYNLGRWLFRVLFTVFCRWKVTGAHNLPIKGPVVVIANHTSWWDPPAVGAALNRQVFFMAKEELFQVPVVGAVVTSWGAFPIKRGQSDRQAMKRAMEVLKNGDVLGIFPEGTRSVGGEMQEFNPGAVHLALKYKAAILPVGLKGTKNAFSGGWFHSFRVNIGEPILPDEFAQVEKSEAVGPLNEKVWKAVADLARG